MQQNSSAAMLSGIYVEKFAPYRKILNFVSNDPLQPLYALQ